MCLCSDEADNQKGKLTRVAKMKYLYIATLLINISLIKDQRSNLEECIDKGLSEDELYKIQEIMDEIDATNKGSISPYDLNAFIVSYTG